MSATALYPPQPRLTWANIRAWAGLVAVLSVRNFRVRYLRMRLGPLWAILQPLAQAVVLTIVFVKIFHVSIPHYPVYVLSGVMTWQCFQQSTVAAAMAAVDNSQLLKKVPVPVTVFPLAAVGGQLIAFGLQSTVLILAALVNGHVTWAVLLLPLAVVLVAATAIGLGLLVGAFVPGMRELKILLETGLLLAFYATPVLYDPRIIPHSLKPLLYANPMAGVLEIFRAALLGRPTDGPLLLLSLLTLIPLVAAGLAVYHRRSGDFGDLL